MGEELRWGMGIEDKLSDPALRGAMAMEKLVGVLEKMVGATEKVDRKLEHGGEGIGRFVEKLHAGIEVAHRFGEAIEGIGEKGLDWVFESTAFKENTLLAMKAVTGSAEQARDLFRYAEQFAANTPLETRDVAKYEKSLIIQGFNPAEMKTLLAATSDFGALNNMDSGAMERFVFHLGRIKSEGKLDGQVLRELAISGIPLAKLYENIAKYLGTDVKNAQAEVSAGAVDSNTAIASILDVITEKGGGKLGQLTYDVGHTVQGLWSTLKSAPQHLFENVDKTPGWLKLQSFMQNMADELDPASGPVGKKLQRNVDSFFSDIFTTVFGDFAGPAGAGQIEQVFEKFERGLQDVEGGIIAGTTAIKGFVGGLFDGLDVSGDLFGPDGKLDPKQLDNLKDSFHDLGVGVDSVAKSIMQVVGAFTDLKSQDGFLGDVLSGRHGIIAAGSKSVVSSVMDVMSSPGRWAQEGSQALLDTLKSPEPDTTIVPIRLDTGRAGGGNAGSGNAFNTVINVEGGGHDPETLARHIAEANKKEQLSLAENMVHEQGHEGED